MIIDVCSWNNPGHNPYVGEVPAAVERYKDIPAEVRAKLRARMESRKYDDLAVIRRDSITGYDTEYSDLRDMHFGKGTVCRQVNRGKWAEKHEEVGLVYCEQDHCLIVPTVCRNVSRVTRVARPVATLPEAQFVSALIPPGGNFAVVSYPEIVAPAPSFRTPAPWIVTTTAPGYFFPPPVMQPVAAPAPSPTEPPPKTFVPPQPIGKKPEPPVLPPIHPPIDAPAPPTLPPWDPAQPVSPPVPEPSPLSLLAIGLLTAFVVRKFQ